MGQLVSIIIAVMAFLLIYTVGVKLMASFSRSQPPPAPTGELRRVRLTYRCQVCGTEVRMTKAPRQEPEPPRCCMQEMDLIANSDE